MDMGEQLIIGERLFILRNQHQMTQEELAEELNVSRQSISKWELNKALPDLERIIRISRLYDVSLNYILFGTEDLDEKQKEIPEQESVMPLRDKGNPDLEEQDERAQESLSDEKHVRAGRRNLLISIIIIGILAVAACLITGYFLWNNAWNKRNMEERLVQVTKVYEQYTKADIVEMQDNYEVKQTVWLDVDGVRENDFVYCYARSAGNKLYMDYYPRTWLFSAAAAVVFIVLFLLLYMELKNKDE